MERGGNYDNQYQQSYQNQGIPIGNQQYGGYQPNNLDMIPNQKRTSDTLATVSLVIGIISIVGFCCLGGFLGIVGAILGIIAIADQYCNKKAMAIIGTALSTFAFIFTIFALIFGALVPEEDNYNTDVNDIITEQTYEDTKKIELDKTISIDKTETISEEINESADAEIVEEIDTLDEMVYEYTITFSNTEGFQYTCTDETVEIEVYEHIYDDNYTQEIQYYIVIPNGEYAIEYIGGNDYLMDPVGHVCSNNWVGYSQANGKLVDNTGYTIQNVPDDNSKTWYEPDDFTVINRTTEGSGRITIANGDTLVISDNTKQILYPFFGYSGEALFKLHKLK